MDGKRICVQRTRTYFVQEKYDVLRALVHARASCVVGSTAGEYMNAKLQCNQPDPLMSGHSAACKFLYKVSGRNRETTSSLVAKIG